MKVLICWSHISGYMAACWRALAARDVDLNILAFRTDSAASGTQAAFKDDVVQNLNIRLLSPQEQADSALIFNHALELKPDIIVIPGWFHQPYTALARSPQFSAAKFIMTIDTPRRDTLRQKLGRFKIGWLVQRVSRVMVAGERAWQLARVLGAPEQKIRKGMYGVDYAMLAPRYQERLNHPGGWPRKFLFVGRYVQDKGIDILVEGYRIYREQSRQPWPLTCCGAGPLAGLLKDQAGITDLGFVQPKDQLAIMSQHGVFVLPSRYDPWPLAIVEATACGLPVIHSEECGSAVEVVRNYYTGRSIATGDPRELAQAMKWCEEHHDELPAMGLHAQPLAEAFSAQAWAYRWETVFNEITSNA